MRRWLLSFTVVACSAGVAAADEKAEAIVKKGIEAHGGADALNKYKAAKFTLKGEVSVQGAETEFTGEMASVVPGRMRLAFQMEVQGMKVTFSQVMNGEKVKRTLKVGDMDLPAGEEDKDEIKLAAARQEAEQLTPLLDAKKFTLAAVGEEDVNGKKADVVSATPKAISREIKLAFDKETGLLVKVTHRGLGPDEGGSRAEVLKENYLSEYKKVNGVQVATKHVLDHDGKKFMTATMSDYEVLETIDDKEFATDK